MQITIKDLREMITEAVKTKPKAGEKWARNDPRRCPVKCREYGKPGLRRKGRCTLPLGHKGQHTLEGLRWDGAVVTNPNSSYEPADNPKV